MKVRELKILQASAVFAIKKLFYEQRLLLRRCSTPRDKMVEGGSSELENVTPRQYSQPLFSL
mgnify:CR=1 FL=1